MTDDELREMCKRWSHGNTQEILVATATLALLDRVQDRDQLAAEVERLIVELECSECERKRISEWLSDQWRQHKRGWQSRHQGFTFEEVYEPYRGSPPPTTWPDGISGEDVVCAALLSQGVTAWPGDATAIVAQMIEAAHKENAALRERLAKVVKTLREYDPNDPQGFLYLTAAMLKEVAS